MSKPRKRVQASEWTETSIARTLAYGLFNGRSVLVIPNCNWTGNECDLLVIEPGLRIIDVEIKISRADLRADAKKSKWWNSRPWSRRAKTTIRRDWPEKVWKHYYVMPEAVWDDSLLAEVNPCSGILLLDGAPRHGYRGFRIARPAKPNRDAKPVTPADAIDLARLASLRMWTALGRT